MFVVIGPNWTGECQLWRKLSKPQQVMETNNKGVELKIKMILTNRSTGPETYIIKRGDANVTSG